MGSLINCKNFVNFLFLQQINFIFCARQKCLLKYLKIVIYRLKMVILQKNFEKFDFPLYIWYILVRIIERKRVL